MEAEVSDTRPADGSLPSGLDEVNGPALECDEQALFLPLIEKEFVDAVREGDFA